MATTSVDYSDFLLVFKALQLKENEPNGMICLCGLEKEDTAFSKDNEDIRKINRLVSSLGLRGSFRDDSFQIETIMVPARSDYPSSTKGEKLFSNEKIKLQKIFRAMSPYKRLVWCGRLLIEFHEENQCCRYLSSALKFYVKAIENVNSARLYNSLPVDMKIQELLRLSTKFRVHQSVFLELLRLLSTPGYYRRSVRTIDDVSLLEDIFRATNDRKIDIFVLWKKFDSRSYHSFYCFIYEKIETFTPLIKFGKTECISIESGGYLMESWSGNRNFVNLFNLIYAYAKK
ncbi:uncharacterized protein [Parasteatoda tepidariorum]|uniref:uncharacterized protein n=1 Tax=Parasteatoda tepidariorum TaxID=114398 RepID=UPI00077FA4A9|nr:uncharacterized protein LOC107447697 [Parasteatoda tepidariorum]